MDEYEDCGLRTDLTLVELYWCPERFVQHSLELRPYDEFQEDQYFKAKDLKRDPRQLKDSVRQPLQQPLTVTLPRDGGASD